MSKFVKKIIEDVENYKKKGHKKITLTELLNYLNGIAEKAEKDAEYGEYLSEISKLRYQRRLTMYTAKLASKQESFRAIISFATNSSRTLFLLNGGAAIAVLAFLGNIWSKSAQSSGLNLLNALVAFSVGLIFSVLCVVSSYISQSYYTENTKISVGHKWRTVAIIWGLLGLIAFGVGVFCAYQAFSVGLYQ